MTLGEATIEMTSMCAAEEFPQLSPDEISRVISNASRRDEYGLLPYSSGWTPTYDLDAAAADGWRIKAAKWAGRIDISESGERMSRSQGHKMAMEMVKMYAGRRVSSSSMSTAGSSDYCGTFCGIVNI